MPHPRCFFLVCLLSAVALADTPAKPRAVFFPLGGDAPEQARERCTYSMRVKLDRTGVYEVIDGPQMNDLVQESHEAITFDTPPEKIRKIAKLVDATVIVWGELATAGKSEKLRLKILDLRESDPKPRTVEKTLSAPTDLRFASEEVLEKLAGIKPFEHPSETPVQHDATAEELWKKNPNLVVNGDFSAAGGWEAIFRSEQYPVEISDKLPAVDKVNIYRLPLGGGKAGKPNNVLAMNLSRDCAETNGMACLSKSIEIAPNTRYRLSFRYKSDGPTLHVFVKGYTTAEDIKGQKAEREIYRRQVPPSGATHDKWVEVVDELNPQHVHFPVQTLRIDLYAYLKPGTVMFDDVVLKAVGKQTREARDPAIKQPLTRPTTTPTP